MPGSTDRTLWTCLSGFATFDKKGTPTLYAAGQQVFGDDPILKTHRDSFVEATDKADRAAAPKASRAVEQATAEPGEKRTVSRGKS